MSVAPFYRCFVWKGGKVSFRYLNHVFVSQHGSAANASLKESTAANKAFI